jgi:hypothetical protein
VVPEGALPRVAHLAAKQASAPAPRRSAPTAPVAGSSAAPDRVAERTVVPMLEAATVVPTGD